MKKSVIGIVLVVFIFRPLHPQNTEYKYSVILQPYSGTVVSIEEKNIPFRIIRKDNTLAEITFTHAAPSAEFLFRHPGYREEKHKLNSGETGHIIMNGTDSAYRFHSYYKTGKQPKSVTFIDNTRISVPLLDDTHIDIIDVVSGRTSALYVPENYALKKGFVETLVIPERNEIWISQMTTACVHVFDLHSMKYKYSIQTKGRWSKVLAYNKDMKRVFLTNWESHDITVIDPEKRTEEYSIPCYGVPRGIVFSDDGKSAYVCQYYAVINKKEVKGEILKIDLSTGKIVKKFGVPGAKRHMVKIPEKNYLVVSDMGRRTVNIYDMKTDSLVKEIPVFSHPNTIALSPDSRCLYVSCRGPNNPKSYLIKGFVMGRVYVIDMNALSVTEFIEGGNQCTGLDVSPDGRKFVFSDFLDDAVRVYEKL